MVEDIEPFYQVDLKDEEILNAITHGVVVPLYSLEFLLNKLQSVAESGAYGRFYLKRAREPEREGYQWSTSFNNSDMPEFKAPKPAMAVSKLILHLSKQKLL